jgi:hypothetical protein
MSMFAWLTLTHSNFPLDLEDGESVLDVRLLGQGRTEIKSALVTVPITVGPDHLIVHITQVVGDLTKAHFLYEYDGLEFADLDGEPDLVIKYGELQEEDEGTILYISGETEDQYLELWLSNESPKIFVPKLPTIDDFK